jgi:glycosyltransferase involved in cell wall biosynthesis
LFIFPSESEGMSIMLLEVASAGTPLICSDIPENMEVFSYEEVTYFRNKDYKNLGERISFALGNRDILLSKAQKAIDKIRLSYSWKRISRQYDGLYRTVMENKKN